MSPLPQPGFVDSVPPVGGVEAGAGGLTGAPPAGWAAGAGVSTGGGVVAGDGFGAGFGFGFGLATGRLGTASELSVCDAGAATWGET